MPPVINVHTHFQPSGIEQALEPLGLTWLKNAGGSFTFRAGKVEYRMPPTSKRNEGFFGANLHTRLPAMKRMASTFTCSPRARCCSATTSTWTPRWASPCLQRRSRRGHRRFPDRFWGAAQLPMQDPQMATEELERAVRELDLHSASNGGGVHRGGVT